MNQNIKIEEISQVEKMRHTLSHVLAQAVLNLYPNTKLGIGPAIENGFYYDFEFKKPITDEVLPKIEQEMLKIIKKNAPLKQIYKSREETQKFFEEKNQKYKLDLIKEIPDKKFSLYISGDNDFTDLCRGPHLKSTGQIKAFKLTNIAGAYWKGSEKNPMLTRIYGIGFESKKELKDYEEMLEEAQKRDHRKLGKTMDLFHFQEESPGAVFWHQKGWALFQTLVDFIRKKQLEAGYKEVNTPEIIDRALWEKSGHWEKFHEYMYTTITPDERTFAIKPMNCPGHCQIYNQGLKSYKDLPLKLSEFGKVHRYEPSGSLHGLMRVRSFTQDDAHIFCTEEQITEESVKVTKLILDIYKAFGFENISLKYADRPAKRVGEDSVWDKSEQALLEAIKASKVVYTINKGEGAFYGPKIEFVLRDAIGRDWQCGTLQVDLNLPGRLGATYIDKDGKKKIPVMLHRALFGSLERFTGILIEHYAGKLPFWLSPVQVAILPISEEHHHYAKEILNQLEKKGIRTIIDLKNEKINYKIREHSLEKIPVLMICGTKEMQDKTITLRRLGQEDQQTAKLDEIISSLSQESQTPKI